VLYSSSNAVTGGLGEVDYCAANAFLDAFAHYNCTQRAIRTTAINWGVWQWDAWQAELLTSLPAVYARVKQLRETYGIDFDEGNEALWRILGTGLPQVLVVTQKLETVLAQWESLMSAKLWQELTAARPDREVYPRPHLRTPYVAPRNPAEQQIAEFWADSLAMKEVGIYDHFLELGGNSLIGLMIIARLEKAFDMKLSATALYESPTVSALSEMLKPDQQKQTTLAHYSERGKRRKERRQNRQLQKQ
jgi:acyl carrier protein